MPGSLAKKAQPGIMKGRMEIIGRTGIIRIIEIIEIIGIIEIAEI